MTREEAKRRAELYSALAEGKAIQVMNPIINEWEYLDINKFDEFKEWYNYRIKPQQKYRPFKSQEECWQEMHKHPDFGWVVSISNDEYLHIGRIYSNSSNNGYGITLSCDEGVNAKFDDMFKDFKFTDREPFGIKEE